MIGERSNFALKNIVGSETPTVLHPTWDYTETDQTKRSFNQSQVGALSTYTVSSDITRYALPFTYIDSNAATLVNSWWEAQAVCELFINSASTGLAKVSNIEQPFATRVFGRLDDYRGVLNLTTVNS